MGNFSNNAITDVGRMLLADVQAGAVFTPTRIVMGSGNLPGGATTQGITEVITPVKSLAINKIRRTPDGKCVFGGVYTNEEVTDPFYFRELALYAKAVYHNEDGSVRSEGAETLYSYGNAGATADYMPAYSTSTVVEKQMDLVVWVGNDIQVELTIESEVYITHEDFDSHAGRHAIGGEDPITPASIGAAHASFVHKIYNTDTNDAVDAVLEAELNDMPGHSVRYICLNDNVGATVFYGGLTHITINKVTDDYASVEAIKYHTFGVFKWRRCKYQTWQQWEWDNPPLDVGIEYRTTERRNGAVVYQKLDTDGILKYRVEGSNTWIPYATGNGAVKKTGDTMTGDIRISMPSQPSVRFTDTTNGAGAVVQLGTNQLLLASQNISEDLKNYRLISLKNSTLTPGIAGALTLTDTTNGTSTIYEILHSGNVHLYGLAAVPATVE